MQSIKSGLLVNKHLQNVMQMRFRRVGSPGQSQGKKRAEKYFGLKALPGAYCNEREILVTQRSLKFHPGLNTSIDPRDNAIYSTCEGTLLVTTERFRPNDENEYVQKFYKTLIEDDQTKSMFKRYVHVIPKRQPELFRLINLV